MQTATAQLVHPTTHLEQEARILFDSGSYRTYVTEDLADSLKLTIDSRENISVMTFGCSKVQQITAPTTVLHLKLADGSVFPITATVVPKITGAITRTTLPTGLFQTWKHLWAKQPLADTYPATAQSTNIDLLIGNDYYLDLTLPTRIELQPGLYLLASRLGWIFSGRTSIVERAPERTESLLVMSSSTPSVIFEEKLDHVSANHTGQHDISTPFTIEIQRFSSLSRLLRVTAWIHRFLNNICMINEKRYGPFRADELAGA